MADFAAMSGGPYRSARDISFPDWIGMQSHRTDDIGRVARREGLGALSKEQKRELIHRAIAEWAALAWVNGQRLTPYAD